MSFQDDQDLLVARQEYIEHLEFQNEKLQLEVSALTNSHSWRATKFLRILTGILRKLKKQRAVPPSESVADSSAVLSEVNGDDFFFSEVLPEVNEDDFFFARDILNQRIRTMQPIESFNGEARIERLNIVLDSLEQDSLFGGVATALILGSLFCRKKGIALRIITRSAPPNPIAYKTILRLNEIEEPCNVSFYTDCDRNVDGHTHYKLEVTEEDIFLATSWWSAHAIRTMGLKDRFFYILQEVETFFYPHGDEHFLCSEILKSPNIDFIVNSKYLFKYFGKQSRNIVENGICFDPAFSTSLYRANFEQREGKHQLFFYARPGNPRNLYFQGLELINACVNAHIIDTDKWDIFFAGSEGKDVILDNGYKVINKGILGWKEYTEFLNEIDLAISLMYTPHPSYPPFDVACSGGVVVTNACLNKQTFESCKNVIVSELDYPSFSKAVADGLQLAEDMQTRSLNYENMTIPRSWEQALEKTLAFMEKRINEKSHNII